MAARSAKQQLTRVMISMALVFVFPAAFAEEVKPTENTHGCLMRFCDFSGGCTTQFFTKVADDEYDSEDGESQIWGYNPNDIHYDRKGNIMFVPALSKKFIRAGGAGMLKACTCHCPQW